MRTISEMIFHPAQANHRTFIIQELSIRPRLAKQIALVARPLCPDRFQVVTAGPLAITFSACRFRLKPDRMELDHVPHSFAGE